MSDNEIGVRITADASGVAPAVSTTVTEIQKLGPALNTVNTAAKGTAFTLASLSEPLNKATTAMASNRASAGQMQFAMRDLAYQIQDVGSSFGAMGFSARNVGMVFAQQGPQFVQAIALMQKEAKGFIGFMGGPWGAVLVAAAGIIGAQLIPKLLDAGHEAAELKKKIDASADSADAFGNAESNLGKVIDLQTGKMKTHNAVLIEFVKVQAQANLLAAQAKEIEAGKAATAFAQPTWTESLTGFMAAGADETGYGGKAGMAAQSAIVAQYKPLAGIVSGLSAALSNIKVTGNPLLDGDLSAKGKATGEALKEATAQVDKLAAAGQLAGKNLVEAKKVLVDMAAPKMDQIAAAMSGNILNGGKIPGEMAPYKKETAKKAPSRMGEWEAELAEQKVAIEEKANAEGTFREMSLAQERDYWQKILDAGNHSKEEQIALRKKVADANSAIRKQEFDAHIADLNKQLDAAKGNEAERLKIAEQIAAEMKAKFGEESKQFQEAQDKIVKITQEAAEQRRQIEVAHAEALRRIEAAQIADEEAAARFRVEMGLETVQQEIAEQQRLAKARYDAATTAVDTKIAANKGVNDVKYGAALDEKLALDRNYELQRNQLERQAALERTQIQRQALAQTASLWGQQFGRLLTLQQGFGSTVRGLWNGMANVFSNIIAQMVEKWMTAELAKLGITQLVEGGKTAAVVTGAATRTAAEVASAATTTTVSATTGLAQIAHSAAVAAARVYASIAQIPVVGPFLAPAMAAAALFGVMKLAQTIFSAEGGMGEVPADGTMIYAHKKEMVLPASLATPLRAMLQGGGAANINAPFAANDAGGKGGDTHYNLHFHGPTDKASIAKWMMENQRGVAAAAHSAVRNGFDPAKR